MTLKELSKQVKHMKVIKEGELRKLIEEHTALTFTINSSKNDQYIIVHPSTRLNYKYQISTFDNSGAIMDSKHKNIEEVIEQLLKGVVYNKSKNNVYYKYSLQEVV